MTWVAARSHAVGMATLRVWDRGSARAARRRGRLRFPSSARQRFGFEHETMSAGGIAHGGGRHPAMVPARRPASQGEARHALGGGGRHVARDGAAHPRVHAFCAGAFGRPCITSAAMSVEAAAANRPGLSAAYRLACEDEALRRARLPLLFRVDRELAIPAAIATSPTAGAGVQCHDVARTRDACGTSPVRRDRRAKAGGPSAGRAKRPYGGGRRCGVGCGGGCGGN